MTAAWRMAALVGLLCGVGPVLAQQRPRVTITTPTTAGTYRTETTPLMLRGTASGRQAVVLVTWATDRGDSGTADGTTSWSASIPLQPGRTRVTVTASDAQHRQDSDTLTVTLATQPLPPDGPITLFWSWQGTTGDSFQVERCMQTAQGCPMAFLTTQALTERQWTDIAVQVTQRYCYRLAVVTQGMLGDYSNTLCSS